LPPDKLIERSSKPETEAESHSHLAPNDSFK
jgi:hypothetical protein